MKPEPPRPAAPETDIRRAESQMEIGNITLANVRLGKISPNDLTIRRSTLIHQAQRADAEGYPQLENTSARQPRSIWKRTCSRSSSAVMDSS